MKYLSAYQTRRLWHNIVVGVGTMAMLFATLHAAWPILMAYIRWGMN